MSPSFQISLPFRIPQCVSSLEERKADTSLKKNYNNAPNLSPIGIKRNITKSMLQRNKLSVIR